MRRDEGGRGPHSYDYRYSQLIFVFVGLLREGRINEEQLHGLSEEKLSYIERIVLCEPKVHEII